MSEAEVTREEFVRVCEQRDGFATAFWNAEDTILVQRSIIDRLRDGCYADIERGKWWLPPAGYNGFEPMTPEQAAVMSRE